MTEQRLQDLINQIKTLDDSMDLEARAQLDRTLANELSQLGPAELESALQQLAEALSQSPLASEAERVASSEEASGAPAPASVPAATWAELPGRHIEWKGQLVNPEPAYVACPQSVADIVALVKSTPPGDSIDIVGAGLSTNGVFAKAGARLLMTEGLGRKLEFEPGLYKGDPIVQHWYRTEAGVRANVMFDQMWDAGLSLNWGGATPQALIGAATTSSHKSGFCPSLQDFVLSFDIVTPDGTVVRLEPKNGITDRAAFEAHPTYQAEGRKLIQDDELFYSSIILCNTGIVYSVIIQAEPKFWLALTREYHENWDTAVPVVKAKLESQRQGNGPWQFELWALPRQKRMMVVTHEKRKERPANVSDPSVVGGDIWCVAFQCFLKALETGFVRLGYDVLCRTLPSLFERTIETFFYTRAVNEPIYLESRHYGGGGVPDLLMNASENVVEYQGDHTPFEWLAKIRAATIEEQSYNFSSPLSMRFVGPSKHALSMFKQDGVQQFMVVETIAVPNALTGQEILRAVDRVFQAEGRPHWGLNNFLREQPGRVEQMYGKDLRTWRTTRNKLVGDQPNRFRMATALNREMTFVGRHRVDVVAKVVAGATSVSAWYFVEPHQTNIVKISNQLPVDVRVRQRDGEPDHVVPARGQIDWAPDKVEWVKDASEFPRQAMKIAVEQQECARVFLRMLHGQKVDRRLHIETGGGLYGSRPLVDLPVDRAELEVSGEYVEPLHAVYDAQRRKTVFYLRGEDGRLHHFYPDAGGWNCDSTSLAPAGAIRGVVSAVFNPARSHSEVFVRALNGQLHHFYVDFGKGGWQHDATTFGTIDGEGGIAALYSAARKQPEFFVAGADKRAEYHYHNGTAFTVDPGSLGETDGHMSAVYNTRRQHADVFVRNRAGEIEAHFVSAGRWDKCGLLPPGSSGLISAVYNAKGGFSQLFCRSVDGQLALISGAVVDGEYGEQRLGVDVGDIGGVMTAACGPSHEHPSVFVRGGNGLLHYVYHNGTHWAADGTSFVAAGRVESASAVWGEISNHAEVVVRGEDGKISHFHVVNGRWQRDTVSWLSP